MNKHGELRSHDSFCDKCNKPALTIRDGEALCGDHAQEFSVYGYKEAGADDSALKSAAEKLADKHR